MDIFDRKDVKADQFEKGNIVDLDTAAGKYATKSRKSTVKLFTKSATHWENYACIFSKYLYFLYLSSSVWKFFDIYSAASKNGFSI